MVGFKHKRNRVQYDNETKRQIYEEYINSNKSLEALGVKYDITKGTVYNIVKKFRDQKKKEAQFFKENTYSKQKPLSVAQEVKRIEHTRKPEKPQQRQQEKPIPMQQKPQNELRKSARREVISINTSQGAPAEPFRPRPSKPKDPVENVRHGDKKLERKSSLKDLMQNFMADVDRRYYNN